MQTVTLETSQHIAGFYERVGGGRVLEITKNGYEPRLHKIKLRREMTCGDCATIARQLAALRIP
jgi:hypothetical protein